MNTYYKEQIGSAIKHKLITDFNGIIKIKIASALGETNYMAIDNDKAIAIVKILTGKDYS